MSKFTKNIRLFSGYQPENVHDDDYSRIFRDGIWSDPTEYEYGLYLGYKWENLFHFASIISDVDIPKNSIITDTKIYIGQYSTSHATEPIEWDDDVALTIKYEDTDNANSNFIEGVIFTFNNFNDRNWSTSTAEIFNTTNIKIDNLIQEIVNRPGWSSGNTICLLWDINFERWYEYYELYVTYPKLFITGFDSLEFYIEVLYCQVSDFTTIFDADSLECNGVTLSGTALMNQHIDDVSPETKSFSLNMLEDANRQAGKQVNSSYTGLEWQLWADYWFDIGYYDGDPGGIAQIYTSVSMAQGTEILSAQLRWNCKSWYDLITGDPGGPDLETYEVIVKCQAADNAALFSTETDFNSRTWETASETITLERESWTYWDETNQAYETWWHVLIDVTDLVQSVINRSGWSYGNNICFWVVPANYSENDYFELTNYFAPNYIPEGCEAIHYLDISLLTPDVVFDADPFEIEVSLSGQEDLGTAVWRPDPFEIETGLNGILHTFTTLNEPNPYGSALSFNAVFEVNYFDPINLVVSLYGEKENIGLSAEIKTFIYLCYLTGYQDGLDDLLIPISSFQCTLRADYQSYLQVVTPAYDYADEIEARANGEIRVIMVEIGNGVQIQQEEIAKSDFSSISMHQGTTNQSITLSGYSTYSAASPKTLTIENGTYYAASNGSSRMRFPVPDLNIRPGDTIISNGKTITANTITMYVSERQQQMEISE